MIINYVYVHTYTCILTFIYDTTLLMCLYHTYLQKSICIHVYIYIYIFVLSIDCSWQGRMHTVLYACMYESTYVRTCVR